MKKEILIHLLYLVPFFIFVALRRDWLALSYWPFWIGGLVGMVLPYLDHFVYIYGFAPQELSSQRVISLVSQKQIWQALDLALYTAHERAKLIFHTVYFQAIFWVLTFLLVTSSGSVFGIGLALSFCLHLVIDQLQELFSVKNLNSWFKELQILPPEGLDMRKSLIYFGVNVFLLLLMGLVL